MCGLGWSRTANSRLQGSCSVSCPDNQPKTHVANSSPPIWLTTNRPTNIQQRRPCPSIIQLQSRNNTCAKRAARLNKMLALRDENAVNAAQTIRQAQGKGHLAPKTPGARYPKTPSGHHDENAVGGKTILGKTKGTINQPARQRLVTPSGMAQLLLACRTA